MKFIVMTNPAFGNNFIKELILSGLKPEFIVTESPYEIKAKKSLSYPSKKALKRIKFIKNRGVYQKKYQPYFMAKKYGIEVVSSHKANSKFVEQKIKAAKIDYIFTFIFKLLKPNIYNAPLKGSINFHPSNLPYNRGATPWNWIVHQQISKTKISFHYITKGIDSGSILKQYDIPLPLHINSTILKEYLFNLGSLYFVQLIFELKYNLLSDPIENLLSEGSYKRPFGRDDIKIVSSQNFDEIKATINASRDTFHNAQFEYDHKNHHVVNCIELHNYAPKSTENVLMDNDGNFIVKTRDEKFILLITNKTNLKLK